MKQCLDEGDTVEAKDSLQIFLDFCAEEFPAEHFMVFLVGHGMVVGNDAFLPDEEPNSAISLEGLKEVIGGFSRKVGYRFELLAMHSCSMSSLEVAYQLRDTAKFMMASQGLAFVGSWPYRQLLKNLFNAVKNGEERTEEGVRQLIHDTY
jgi:hypothetical protein